VLSQNGHRTQTRLGRSSTSSAVIVRAVILRELLTATTAVGAKTVLVGDEHQLAPVKARGGMFAQLSTELPGHNTSRKCGGCATPTNAPPPWRCATGTETGCVKRSATSMNRATAWN
jgi:hypothetical protein